MNHRVPRPQFIILLSDPGCFRLWTVGAAAARALLLQVCVHLFLSGLHGGANLLAPGAPCAQHAEMPCTSDLPLYCPTCHVGRSQCPHPPHTGVVTLLHHIHLVDARRSPAVASVPLASLRRTSVVSRVVSSSWLSLVPILVRSFPIFLVGGLYFSY